MPRRPRAAARAVAVAACATLAASGTAGCARSVARAEPVSAEAAVDCKVAKCVALTFDDGPGPHTGKLLDVLVERDAHATFFLIGEQVQRHPKIARRIARAGFEIGDHTWNHAALTSLTAERIHQEIDRTADAIRDATGVSPTVMRPPEGLINPSVAGLVGLPVVLWSVDTQDWHTHDGDRTVDAVRKGVHPGSIVLMHDVYGSTVKAVPRIVDLLRAKGYTLVTVTELYGHPLKAGKKYKDREGAYAEAHAG